MTDFLRVRIGEHVYKSPRRDGRQNFVIDEALWRWKPSSSIVVVQISVTGYGGCLVKPTPWRILNRSSWNITIVFFIFPEVIRQRQRRCDCGTYRCQRRCLPVIDTRVFRRMGNNIVDSLSAFFVSYVWRCSFFSVGFNGRWKELGRNDLLTPPFSLL